MYFKTLIAILILAGTANFINLCAQNVESTTAVETTQNGAKIKFDRSLFDFGTVNTTHNGEFEFTFTNEGNEPLLVSRVQGCCGSRIVDYTKEPIQPGETGFIKLFVYVNNPGVVINKTITVITNDLANPTTYVRFKVNVENA